MLGHSHLERLKNSGGWRLHAWRGAQMGGLGDASLHYAPGSARRGCRVSTIPGKKPYVAEMAVKDEGGRETICLQNDAKHLTFLTCATRLTNPSDTCHSTSWIYQNTAIHSYLNTKYLKNTVIQISVITPKTNSIVHFTTTYYESKDLKLAFCSMVLIDAAGIKDMMDCFCKYHIQSI